MAGSLVNIIDTHTIRKEVSKMACKKGILRCREEEGRSSKWPDERIGGGHREEDERRREEEGFMLTG